jgi:hypothetical protein
VVNGGIDASRDLGAQPVLRAGMDVPRNPGARPVLLAGMDVSRDPGARPVHRGPGMDASLLSRIGATSY